MKEIIENFKRKFRSFVCLECSALENRNIVESFQTIAKEIYNEENFEAYEKALLNKEKTQE